MAPKKPNPMEDPPAASSSEDEEEEEDVSSDSEGSSADDDTQEQEPPKQPSPPPQKTLKQSAIKKPDTTPLNPPKKPSSSGESETESDSDSESDAAPRPIATKPMGETPKTTKPRSKPASSKRPNETEEAAKSSKRAKKKVDLDADLDEEEQKKPSEDTKKQLFQRLWSEDDEIAVLKGMIEYSTKKGIDPNQDLQAFYEYIKNSLNVDVSKTQFVDKIRRLKKKYENNFEKGMKKGEDRTFSKPHEQKAYDLSKRLWGTESSGGVVESAVKSNGKPKKNQNQKGNSKSLAALKAELIDGSEVDKNGVDNDKGNGLVKSANLKEKDKVFFDKNLGVAGMEEFVLHDGLYMIEGAKKEELVERWKKLQVAQLELFLQRNELIKEQAKVILDAMK